MTWIPTEPREFRSAVPFYRHREPYPPALIARVAELCGLTPGTRVLDLGCGPGPLAIALAKLGLEVVAVDPEPAMLAAAAEAAQAAGVTLALKRGSSFDLLSDEFPSFDRQEALGRFRAVTIGRAFHWMDRSATLAVLDRLIEPGGAVVLFATRHIALGEPGWRQAFEAVVARYADADDRALRSRRVRDEAVLLASPFDDLERLGRVSHHALDLDAAIGRALSRSSSAPAALGDRRVAFEEELRHTLRPFLKDGLLAEVIEGEALIARRSRDRTGY